MSRTLLEKAQVFATYAHAGQVRKYTHDPYTVHLATVANKVSAVTDEPNIIAAAWLHDTVEDTPVTFADIEDEFGKTIRELVESLTDISKPGDGNRKVRKELDRNHLKEASPGAKTVKLADLIDNAHSIIDGNKKFAKVFMEEMKLLLEVLREGHADLYQEAVQIVCDYERNL